MPTRSGVRVNNEVLTTRRTAKPTKNTRRLGTISYEDIFTAECERGKTILDQNMWTEKSSMWKKSYKTSIHSEQH